MSTIVDWIRLNWSGLAMILGLALVFLLLRNKPSADINSLQALDNNISSTHQPVLIEFYSNF